jgi:hypothetical protein
VGACAGIGGGLLNSPELRGGGGLGGSRDFAGLAKLDPVAVCVRLGGGIDLSLASLIKSVGRA